MKLDLAQVLFRLSEIGKQPEEVFPWFVPSIEDVDRAEVLDLGPVPAGSNGAPIEGAEPPVLRRTRIVSCSAITHEEWQRVQMRISRIASWNYSELERREARAKKGEPQDEKPLLEADEAKPRGALAVLTARVLAEGIEAWDKPPLAVVDAPGIGIKRGQPFPKMLCELLPARPASFAAGEHEALLQAVEALPNRYAERVFLAIFWLSQLDPMRFLSAPPPATLDGRKDAGKDSGSPSGTRSSASAAEPGSASPATVPTT